MQKNFPGGYVVLVGANSPASLAMRPIRILLADEIDRYPNTAGNEGDPLSLAEKRQTTFWNRKEVNISTPTAKGASRIEVEYQNSTMEEWNVPCPACGTLQPLVWDQVVYDQKNLDEISYTCEKCRCVSGEIEWKEHFSGGKYVAEHPEAVVSWVLKDPGYRRNELLDLRNYAAAALELTGLTLKPSAKAPAGPQTGARKGRGSIRKG